jgi:hypothetical protein
MMIYSSGMPLLYLISMLQYLMTYWIDKFLFLRFYRTPPRYGIEMSETVRRIMLAAIFIHFALAFYMYSNSSIFTYSTVPDYVKQLQETIDGNMGSFMATTGSQAYLTPARIFHPHALLHIIGFVMFLLMNLVAGLFSGLCGGSCTPFCCCWFTSDARQTNGSKSLQTFSHNIYDELSVEDLRAEYAKTKTELGDYRMMLQQNMFKTPIEI